MSLARIRSPKYRERQRKKAIGLIVVSFFIICLIISAFVLLMRASVLQVDTVIVQGATTVSTSTVRDRVQSILKGSYLGFIPFSNILIIPKDRISSELNGVFKQVEHISIDRNSLNQITVSLTERTPVALVCSGFYEEDSLQNDSCFFVDEHAYVYGAVNNLSDQKFNRYYIPTDKGDVATGTTFVDEKLFHNLQTFMDGSAKAGLAPLGLLLGDSGEYEMYTKGGTTIYFDERQSFDTTLSNLIAFWQNTVRHATSSLDYVNLRFGKTIYYSK